MAAGLSLVIASAGAQCATGQAESAEVPDLRTMAFCIAHTSPPDGRAEIDPVRPYGLDELIDIAERSHPQTRIAWAQARQAAAQVGMERSAYYPHLAGMALLGNQKLINPFPRPLAANGYTMVEMPIADAGLAVEYTILDFGRRGAHLDAAQNRQLAAAAHFERVHQDVAFSVVTAYSALVTAQQKLAAEKQILATAQATQQAAEAQLAQGRATLPDVLNARAGTAHAEFNLEASVGEEQTARVRLREALGAEPSDAISIAPPPPKSAEEMAATISELLEAAQKDRPDLAALASQLRAAGDDRKAAESAYRPTVEFAAKGAVQSIWPTVSVQDGSSLGDTTQFVWNVGLNIHWNFFDGGARKSEVLARSAEERAMREELRERQDQVARATWTAWVQYRTAVRQQQAAKVLLDAATASYDASREAYGYGVKNLIDLVNAEAQLAEARLADVQARSAVFVSVANLGYTTGTLLRGDAQKGAAQ
jgi:outer membrane protein TolC